MLHHISYFHMKRVTERTGYDMESGCTQNIIERTNTNVAKMSNQSKIALLLEV